MECKIWQLQVCWQDSSGAKMPILVLKDSLIRQTDRICHIDEMVFMKSDVLPPSREARNCYYTVKKL